MSRRALLQLAIIFEGGMLLLALLLGLWTDVPVFGELRLGAAGLLWGVGATVPPLLGLAWLRRSRSRPWVRLRRTLDLVVERLFEQARDIDLLLISLLAGLGEEALFRGWLQPWLGSHLGVVGGLVVASLVFGLAHAVSVAYALLATLMGLWLGGLLLVSGDLFAPMLSHALYDLVALVWLMRELRQRRRREASEREAAGEAASDASETAEENRGPRAGPSGG